MAILAKRLDRFIDKHMVFEDIGDPENGPELSSEYTGPGWALDLAMRYSGLVPSDYVWAEWEDMQ